MSTDAARRARADQQNAEINDLLDQMVGTVREALDEGADPGDLAVFVAQTYAIEPGRACTLAGFAVVRLARQAGDR